MSTTINQSNSLTNLAARIRAEHEAAAGAMKRGAEHAMNAGDLLIEAKAQLKHGRWLPWLAEHCDMSERTAQLYMRMARARPEVEANTQHVADLTLRSAVELLSPPAGETDWEDWDSISEWAGRQLDGPFNDWDFEGFPDNGRIEWLMTKLVHQAKLPTLFAWCVDVAGLTEDRRPALRLCPWDDLLEAAQALAPICTEKADRKHALKFDFADIAAMQGTITSVRTLATYLLGGVLNEIKDRRRISDERYEQEWEQTHSLIMARLDEQFARGSCP